VQSSNSTNPLSLIFLFFGGSGVELRTLHLGWGGALPPERIIPPVLFFCDEFFSEIGS
jgi:hypothetical protein